jgi:hypothetical protein
VSVVLDIKTTFWKLVLLMAWNEGADKEIPTLLGPCLEANIFEYLYFWSQEKRNFFPAFFTWRLKHNPLPQHDILYMVLGQCTSPTK